MEKSKFWLKIVLIIGILLTLVLSSCSPGYRLQKLIRKHPELVDSTTIIKTDTIRISQIKDSLTIKDSTVIDTNWVTKDSTVIQIKKRGAKIEIRYKTKEKKIPYIQTITKKVDISKQTLDKLQVKSKTRFKQGFWLGVILMFGIWLLIKAIKLRFRLPI